MSAAFFLLGGKLKEAIDVIVNNMQDIQLAILICRLQEKIFSKSLEDKPILKSIIEDTLIKRGKEIGDFWLASMGYTMLGQHVNSLNVISEVLESEV